MPEQRNDQSSSEIWHWQVPDRKLPDLLDWFMKADLASDASVRRLFALTGRPERFAFWRTPAHYDFPTGGSWTRGDRLWLWAPGDDAAAQTQLQDRLRRAQQARENVTVIDAAQVPPGGEDERARWTVRRPVTREEFVDYYAAMREMLRDAQEDHYRWTRGKRTIGGDFDMLGLLDDVRVRVVSAGRPGTPLRSGLVSVSLAGELARAMWHRMLEAREIVLCPSCNETEAFPDVRHREICSKSQCRRWYRAKWSREQYAAEKAAQEAKRVKTRKR